MGQALKKLTIRGFKSIQVLEDLELRSLNVLIGANGAGKSNFIDFFRLLRAMTDQGLQEYIGLQGGGDGFCFLGPKRTPKIAAHLEFGDNVYEFDLKPTRDESLLIANERVQYTGGSGKGSLTTISNGVLESVLRKRKDRKSSYYGGPGVEAYVYDAVSSWVVYHFHDTSMHAPMRRSWSTRDSEHLRPDASNIAAFLLNLRNQNESSYALILDTIRQIAPFFDDFALRSEEHGAEEKVRLEWRQKGSDFPFQPSHFSDGTLRFICLATALSQPSPPSTIVIDEPELGLHPYAITLLADLFKSAAEKTQVIVCTQAPTLVDHFEPDDIIVVSRAQGASTFERLKPRKLAEWLEDYSIGELWQKNVVRGGPVSE